MLTWLTLLPFISQMCSLCACQSELNTKPNYQTHLCVAHICVLNTHRSVQYSQHRATEFRVAQHFFKKLAQSERISMMFIKSASPPPGGDQAVRFQLVVCFHPPVCPPPKARKPLSACTEAPDTMSSALPSSSLQPPISSFSPLKNKL